MALVPSISLMTHEKILLRTDHMKTCVVRAAEQCTSMSRLDFLGKTLVMDAGDLRSTVEQLEYHR